MRFKLVRLGYILAIDIFLFTNLTYAQPNCARLFLLESANTQVQLEVIKEPVASNVYRVHEGALVTANGISTPRENLTTFGLASCVGITIFDFNTRVGMVSHFTTVNYSSVSQVQNYVRKLMGLFQYNGGSLINSKITIVYGSHSFFNSDFKTVLDTLVSELQTFNNNLNISSATTGKPRAISLNLKNGNTYEISPDYPRAWSWSAQHDVSLNQLNP